MVTTAQHSARRWLLLVLGWLLVVLGIVLHAVAAASIAALDPLADVVTSVLHDGWVRAAAWAAVTGGAFLVVAGWSRRPSQQRQDAQRR